MVRLHTNIYESAAPHLSSDKHEVPVVHVFHIAENTITRSAKAYEEYNKVWYNIIRL